jgi:2-methylaconitate cis-trans-isomerase PrpF
MTNPQNNNPQTALRAVYMRGGTSRALFFHEKDLPAAGPAREAMILAAMGSPDPHKRQLDGMGGGISSLSKIAIIGPASRSDADIDYTFGQVAVDAAVVSYKGNCGNISSAVGPFAIDEGLVTPNSDTQATVRIHNTNTGKIIVARFALQNGKAAVIGDFALDGVAGTASPIALDFLNPGGSSTGHILPTGNASDLIETQGFGTLEVSLVDVSNPVACVRASDLDLSGSESPADLTTTQNLLERIETIRIAATVKMGLCSAEGARTTLRNLPQIAIVSAPSPGNNAHITVRMISAGQAHLATPLTGGMCLAAAMRIPGTIAHQIARLPDDPVRPLNICHPSGSLTVDATLITEPELNIPSVTVYRSARRLIQGEVFVPKGMNNVNSTKKTTRPLFIGLGQARKLCQMQHKERLAFLSEGLPIILKSAQGFANAAEKLKSSPREAMVLDGHAREEAAKILILIDGVRCPPQIASSRWGKITKNFYDHLTRLIYDDATTWKPTNVRQLREYVDNSRQAHYVEGEFGEYIMPNETLYLREGTLYADIESRDKADAHWHNPTQNDPLLFSLYARRRSLKLAEAMSECGFFTLSGLQIISEIWEITSFNDNETWGDANNLIKNTLHQLKEKSLYRKTALQDHINAVYDLWQIPMYSFDFSLVKRTLEELEDEQESVFYGQIGNY